MDEFRLLGRSGLRVSPLCLGTMTFGESWGADAQESRRIFDAYRDSGGNFIDTADVYADARAETLIGEFAVESRQRLVIATKYSLGTNRGDPNSGGNHRKNLMQSLEASLRRLRTDYVDLYYVHRWDAVSRAEEVVRALEDAVRQGKILHAGVSNHPAWKVASMQTLAELRGWTPFAALQIQYNLVQRDAERELVPMAQAMGLGVLPWSPLAGGLLSGKYGRNGTVADSARQDFLKSNGTLTERALGVADELKEVAGEIGATASSTALAWLLAKPGITAPILGVRNVAQLLDNLAATAVTLTPAQHARLDAAGAVSLGYPHEAPPFVADWLTAGTRVRA